MSMEAMSWTFNASQMAGTSKLVLLGIANHAGATGDNAWPSVETLARYAGTSARTVQRCIVKAEEAGELLVYERQGGHDGVPGDRRPNRYELPLVPGWEPPRGDKLSPRLDAHGVTLVTERGDTGVAHGVTLVTERGDTGVTQTLLEPSNETVLEPSAQLALVDDAPKPAKRDPYTDDFAECWSHYPRKLQRKNAYRAYLARRREGIPAGTLLAATRNYAQTRRGEDERYTLHGSTFFGPNERWADYVDGSPLMVAEAQRAAVGTEARMSDEEFLALDPAIQRLTDEERWERLGETIEVDGRELP